MSEQEHAGNKRSVAGRFAGDVAHMPWWQKALVLLAVGVGIVGVVGQLTADAPAAPAVQPDAPPATPPPGGRTFIGGSPQSPQASPPPAPAADSQATWLAEHAPVLTRSGLGFLGAFMIGWAFRVFVKTMVIVTVLGAAGLLALSYYGVLEVDWAVARQQYTSAAGWLWDQASHLKTAALSHLPATTAGTAGLVVGLLKK